MYRIYYRGRMIDELEIDSESDALDVLYAKELDGATLVEVTETKIATYESEEE